MEIHSIPVHPTEMRYLTFGNGKKIFVILPGLSLKSVLLSADFVASAFSDFGNDFTVYLFDRVEDVPDNYSVNDMAEDTYNVFMNLGFESCSIFGASMGGMIAQCIAIQHPDFIEKLVLGSTTCKVEGKAFDIFSEWISLAKQNDFRGLNENLANTIYCEETLKNYGEEILGANQSLNEDEINKFIKLASALLSFDVERNLGNIKCKTFVIGSDGDLLFGSESSKMIAKKIGAELFIYEKYGHSVYDEAPDFREKMLNFLCK